MRKAIALTIMVAFVVTLAGIAFSRTLEEERDAVRAYLKVIDAKIVKNRAAGKTAVVKKLQADKAATLRRWDALKAKMEGAPMAPSPAVTPPPPATPPRVMAPAPSAPSGGLFGLGLQTVASAGYVMGKSLITGRGDLILGDPLAMGTIVGLSADAVKYRIGLTGFAGKDSSNVTAKGIAVAADGIISLPADMLGGIDSYIGGGVNYVVYKSGRLGFQVYYGIQGDIGLGGKTSVELGYAIIRGKTTSSKGIGIQVGQQIVL